MPYFKSSQDWLDASTLLIEARPSTTRITTRFSIKAVKPFVTKKVTTTETEKAQQSTRPPRGCLVLKTYDPVSGVTLKYRTFQAAEVSRLVHISLGRLARAMAALPAVVVPDEPVMDPLPSDAQVNAREVKASSSSKQQQAGGTGHRKKKGRK